MGDKAMTLDATDALAERDAEIAALRAQVAALRLRVAELQAWKDAVPVDAIIRYYYGTMQIDGIYADDEYNYDSSILEQWLADMA